MTPRFPNAFEAYQWSQEILSAWRDGRAFDPNPDFIRGGTGQMGQILVAMDIENIAWKACREGHPCAFFSRECMTDHYLPTPTERVRIKATAQRQKIEGCEGAFEEYLRRRGYIE